ncbi:MAG: TadE/TadG family type IV pilus assembly protein [Acidimicrobiales bacterium]
MNRHGRPARGEVPGAGWSCPGQATVEVAFLLPVVVLLALAIGQVAVVAHARVSVTHAAREGARVAAVGEGDGAVRAAVLASGSLTEARVRVGVVRRATTVEVTVRYVDPTDVALVGSLLGDVEVVGVAVMRRE